MANHNLPLITSTYSNFVSELDSRLDDITTWMPSSTATVTYLPEGAVRWNDTSYTWEKNTAVSGTQSPTWTTFSARFDININGTVGATNPNTGSFTTLTTSGTTTLAANTTIGGITPVTTTGTQTLTNKTLTTPIISSISNTGTITLPTSTTTLVGTNTTDTLTNKTLTAPKFANSGTITDTSSNILLQFTATGSAINYITLANADSGNSPSLTASGTDTNININLVSKGTGVIQANGVPVITTTGTQTLTNKTISTGSSWQGSAIGVVYGGTGQTTYTDGQLLIGNSATSSLTKTTLTASTGISITNGNGTISISTNSSSTVQFSSLGVNTAAPGAGEIRATGNITAYYSDDRLKKRLYNIDNALNKVLSLNGFIYVPNNIAKSLGYEEIEDVGLSAQQVQAILPWAVVPAPIDNQYLTLRYEKVIPLLVEAIKELANKLDRGSI